MPPFLIIAFREIKLAPLARIVEDGTVRSSNGSLRPPSSALLRFSPLPGVASFEEPIGRTLNLDIYHFPQILNRIF